MELPLLFPTDKLRSVDVGIITIKTGEVHSNSKYRVSGNFSSHVLASICNGTTADDFKDISIIDAYRILFLAWKQTYGADKYINKVQCECGNVNLVTHDIYIDYKKPEGLYGVEHEIESIDTKDISKTKIYKVILKPPSQRSQEVLGIYEEDTDEYKNARLYAHIKSVDGAEKDFDMPMPVYKKTAEMCISDEKELLNICVKSQKCHKCDSEIFSSVGFFDGAFIQG